MRIKKQIALCLSVFMVCLSSQNVFAFGSFNFGNTIKVAIISEEFGASGQSVGVSGQSVGASGQSVGVSGQSVGVSGQRVGASGPSVGASGQSVDASGQRVDASGHINAHALKDYFLGKNRARGESSDFFEDDSLGKKYKIQISSDIMYVDRERAKDRWEDVLKDKDIIVVIIDISLPRNEWQDKMKQYAQRIWKKNRNICVMFVPSQNGVDEGTLNIRANYVAATLEKWAFEKKLISRQCVGFVGRHNEIIRKSMLMVSDYKKAYKYKMCTIQ